MTQFFNWTSNQRYTVHESIVTWKSFSSQKKTLFFTFIWFFKVNLLFFFLNVFIPVIINLNSPLHSTWKPVITRNDFSMQSLEIDFSPMLHIRCVTKWCHQWAHFDVSIEKCIYLTHCNSSAWMLRNVLLVCILFISTAIPLNNENEAFFIPFLWDTTRNETYSRSEQRTDFVIDFHLWYSNGLILNQDACR